MSGGLAREACLPARKLFTTILARICLHLGVLRLMAFEMFGSLEGGIALSTVELMRPLAVVPVFVPWLGHLG